MLQPNKQAAAVLAALGRWETADAALATAATTYLRELVAGGPRGPLTHDALTQLKQHLAWDRYETPAKLLDALHK